MFGQIAGAVIGGLMANRAAKNQARAMDRATEAQMLGYTDARPYIQDMYAGGTAALNDALAAGAYTGPTYAGLNDMQRTGLNNQFGFGTTAFNTGQGLMNTAGGFGTNYQDIYNRASQDSLGNAISYAANNAQPLVDAAMRDSTRQLQERTLPGIGLAAVGSGNTNNSRAGVESAIAQRAYDDRRADVTANVTNSLLDRALNQNNRDIYNLISANQGLGNAFSTGFGMASDAPQMQTSAGAAFQRDEQNQLTADQADFERQRDFALDAYNRYNAGILGRAPQTAGDVQPNLVDPTAATLGGAMSGFGFGRQYLSNFSQPYQMQDNRPSMSYINAPAYTGFGYMGGR